MSYALYIQPYIHKTSSLFARVATLT